MAVNKNLIFIRLPIQFKQLCDQCEVWVTQKITEITEKNMNLNKFYRAIGERALFSNIPHSTWD